MMEIIQLILNLVLGGGLIGTFLYYKPRLNEANEDVRTKKITNDSHLLTLKKSIINELQQEFNNMANEVVDKTKKIVELENDKADLSSINNKLKREINIYKKMLEDNKHQIEMMQIEIDNLKIAVRQIKNGNVID